MLLDRGAGDRKLSRRSDDRGRVCFAGAATCCKQHVVAMDLESFPTNSHMLLMSEALHSGCDESEHAASLVPSCGAASSTLDPYPSASVEPNCRAASSSFHPYPSDFTRAPIVELVGLTSHLQLALHADPGTRRKDTYIFGLA
jgi:hypothetical protein